LLGPYRHDTAENSEFLKGTRLLINVCRFLIRKNPVIKQLQHLCNPATYESFLALLFSDSDGPLILKRFGLRRNALPVVMTTEL
jgi:hypothetical protein